MTTRAPICPYCSEHAQLVDSTTIYGDDRPNYGMFWSCAGCDAYVGTHKQSRPPHQPLGTLANAELREWRKAAHKAFDPLWSSRGRSDGEMGRNAAYRLMGQMLGLTREQSHIAMLSVEQCRELIAKVEERSMVKS